MVEAIEGGHGGIFLPDIRCEGCCRWGRIPVDGVREIKKLKFKKKP